MHCGTCSRWEQHVALAADCCVFLFAFFTTGSSVHGTEPADVNMSQDVHTHTHGSRQLCRCLCVCVCREENALRMHCCQITVWKSYIQVHTQVSPASSFKKNMLLCVFTEGCACMCTTLPINSLTVFNWQAIISL